MRSTTRTTLSPCLPNQASYSRAGHAGPVRSGNWTHQETEKCSDEPCSVSYVRVVRTPGDAGGTAGCSPEIGLPVFSLSCTTNALALLAASCHRAMFVGDTRIKLYMPRERHYPCPSTPSRCRGGACESSPCLPMGYCGPLLAHLHMTQSFEAQSRSVPWCAMVVRTENSLSSGDVTRSHPLLGETGDV